jgi:hypothetical protein
MGLGPSLPPAELARQDLTLLVEVKHLFSTVPEAKESYWGDRTLNRTRSRHDRTRSVSGSSSLARDARALHRRVRSSPREAAKHTRLIGRGGASGHDRPDASGREWVLTGIDQS